MAADGMTKAVVVLLLLALVGCAPSVLPPGPRLAEPRLNGDGLLAADGATLPVRTWAARSGRPRAVVIAVHGFNDYGNFFEAPGTFLAARGITSYAYDQRGFGRAPVRGMWPGMPALVDDLGAMTALVRARHPGLPLFLLGASMGGAVIMVAMTGDDAPPADGIILAAPAVWGRRTMPWYQTAALWLAAHTLPWLEVSGRGLDIQPSDNIEMLRALSRDPLIIRDTRIDTLYGLTDLMDAALAAAAGLGGPALILYGERDEVIPASPTRLMFRHLAAAGATSQRLALYEKGFHMLLRDLQGETVWTDIAHWIGNPSALLPSGADGRAEEAQKRGWQFGKTP